MQQLGFQNQSYEAHIDFMQSSIWYRIRSWAALSSASDVTE